jgi:hypothetical protein
VVFWWCGACVLRFVLRLEVLQVADGQHSNQWKEASLKYISYSSRNPSNILSCKSSARLHHRMTSIGRPLDQHLTTPATPHL